MEKQAHMTHLYGSELVEKSHPRIKLRGKLDTLQAKIVRLQCDLEAEKVDPCLQADLADTLTFLRELSRCEVLEEPVERDTILGLHFGELQDRSHNAAHYFGVATMTLPEARYGRTYAELNCLRAEIREAEVAAVAAYGAYGAERSDIAMGLNRLSSAMHVLMCKSL